MDPLKNNALGWIRRKGFPPLLIQVGTDEILLDDATRFAKKDRDSGVDVTLQIMDGMFHVFQLIPLLSETIKTVGSIAELVSHTLKDHHEDTDYQIMNSGTNIV